MFRMTVLLLVVLLCTVLAGTACAGPAISGSNLMAGVKAAERPANPQPPSLEYTRAVEQFTWNLLQESLKNQGNVLLSPASVFLALSMTLNGADGQTRTDMLAALSAAGLDESTINTASRDWLAMLQETGDKTELFISNSIWLRDSFRADAAFLQRNADYFGAAAYTLDFSLPSAVTSINDWVKTATRSKIDTIVDSIDAAVVMYLINAIYFKSDWETPFAAESTRDGQFYAPTGLVPVAYMNRTGNMAYIMDDQAQGIWLPYVDEHFAFFAIMPEADEDIRSWLTRLEASNLTRLLTSRQETSVDLTLPKFEIRYEDSLLNEMDKLGMGIAFSDGADFSRMNADRLRNLVISDIKHKTFCRVDEKGTEAAAVTSVEMRVTSMPSFDHVLVFDRPFLFGIVDTRTGVPLFAGIMEKPEA